MALEKFIFYLGTDTNGHDEVDGIKLAYELAGKYFPHGHSIREEEGRWMGEQGAVTELTVIVTWLAEADLVQTGEADRRASRFAKAYKDGAFQEAVLVEQQTVNAFLV